MKRISELFRRALRCIGMNYIFIIYVGKLATIIGIGEARADVLIGTQQVRGYQEQNYQSYDAYKERKERECLYKLEKYKACLESKRYNPYKWCIEPWGC